MKAYLFIETGRCDHAEKGEYYRSGGDINLRKDYHPTIGEYPILARHEIEVPANIEDICIDGIWDKRPATDELLASCSKRNLSLIHLPRPKKKVKRWWWVIPIRKGNSHLIVGPLTEEEVHKYYPNQKWYHRIDETMVEVSE